MNEQEQRIAIAELMGWIYPGSTCLKSESWNRWIRPKGATEKKVPDYLADLNAMHEAEKVLRKRPSKWREYRKRLNWLPDYGVCATAPQRAEAFLRTLGLWKESE